MHQPRMNLMLTATVIFTYIVLQSYAEYAFKVFPVEKCPMCKEDWDMASARLKCNSTHGYHCVPNKQLTSLIEFCYPKGHRFPFEKGNCLKLAADGILNQVPCADTFRFGCPKIHYFSNEIFNYPTCLMVNMTFGCFEADHECIYSGVLKNKQHEGKVNTTENVTKFVDNECGIIKTNGNTIAIIVTVLLVIVFAILITVVIICCKNMKGRDRQNRYGESIPLQEVNFEQSEMSTEPNEERNDNVLPPQHISQPQNPADQLPTSLVAEESHPLHEVNSEQSEMSTVPNEERNDMVLPPQHISQPQNSADQFRTSLVEGDFQTFQYLIHKFDKHSLEEVDSNGFNCLHSAAKGGNLRIFKKIWNVGVSVEKKTNDGSNVLHIAAHRGFYPICKYILDNHAALFSVKDNLGMNPAHCAANTGQYHILDLMFEQGCNLFDEDEKNNENIVHLACMGGSLEVCQFVKANKKLEKLLHAKNGGGWNSIQCATKNGHLDIVKFLLGCKVDVENKSNENGKNCLHTACEFGKYKICEYILSEAPNLITDTDSSGYHAGHYAAKIGHVNILQLLINTNKNAIQKTSKKKKNILHTACKYAHYDVVVKIAEVFPSMVKEITEKGWNAALFITHKAAAEEERIKILKHLLDRGLDVYQVSKSGKTILVNARKNNLKNIEQYLSQKFPDLIGLSRQILFD